MDPSEISPEHELTVRNHIRQTFLSYARKHITNNHVAYTESNVEQIFTESLDFIPLADPHALVLPPDPLDILFKSLGSLEPFGERWTTDADTVHKLKAALKNNVGEGRELRSDVCWQENDHMYTQFAEIYRHMIPILTNRARRQTPKPSSNALRASLPRSQPALFERIDIKLIVVEQVKEFDVPILEEVLNLRPTMDTATRSYILSRFKLANPPGKPTEINVHVSSFLRADSPPPREIPRPFSPPVFPRANSGCFGTGIGNARNIVDRLDDIHATVPEELEDDINKMDMTIIDGWATLPISSPYASPPSQGTEIDELWEDSPTPPGTPATSLYSSRMDDVEVPRIYKPGHALPPIPKPRGPKSLKSLMEHLKPVVHLKKAKEVDCTTPARQKHEFPLLLSSTNAEDGRSIYAHDSILGQPPSICTASPLVTGDKSNLDYDTDSEDFEMDMERGLDVALRHVYHEVQEEGIEGCVLEERLDEKDVALMDAVPHLPPPTAHPSTSLQPRSMKSLICGDKGNTVIDANLPRYATPQSVKGIKPLNLELSWRPFKFTPPVPTDESVTCIEGPPLDGLEKQGYTDKTSEAKVQWLLRDIESASYQSATGCKNFHDRRDTGNIGLSPPRLNRPFPEDEGFELVLTKRERRLLAGLSEFEDLQDHHAEDIDNRQEQRGVVTEGHDRHVNGNDQLLFDEHKHDHSYSADFHGDRHLHSSSGNLNPTRSFLRSDGQRFASPVSSVFHDSGVLNSVPGIVNHFDVLDDDVSSAEFKGQDVVFDDSGVALPILDNHEGCYRDRVAGHPRYQEAIYSPENIGNFDNDKENEFYCMYNQPHDQPSSLPSPIQNQHGSSSLPTRLHFPRGHGHDPIGFFPLSFGAESGRVSKDPIVPGVVSLDNDVERIRRFEPDNDVWNNKSLGKIQVISKDNPENVFSFLQYFVHEVDSSSTTPASKRRRLDDPTTTTIVTREYLDDHLALRNKPLMLDPPPPTIPLVIISQTQVPQSCGASPPRSAPPEILDDHTIRLPDVWNPPATSHCYLASMTLIQKRALLRALRASECQVHLMERYTLGGMDIVIDPDTAVLFSPLLALPSEVEGLSDRISQASWRYTHILVILEAFPSSDALTADDGNKIKGSINTTRLTPYAFSPPILKAVRGLRRLLSIADSFGTKNAECEIHWAFANDVGEAALFVRTLGDLAEERAVREGRDALWGDRGWLQVDENEDEADLAAVQGMNPFAAFVMLYEKSLQDILDMSPGDRGAEFSDLVGNQRIASLNAIIEQRKQEMDVDAATESGSILY